jgi:hypothetical protein
MDSEALLADAVKRRWWLLSKALESASFEDALKLARAAEEFLASGGDAAVLGLPELCPRCAASNLAGEPAGKPAELEKQPERLPEKQPEKPAVNGSAAHDGAANGHELNGNGERPHLDLEQLGVLPTAAQVREAKEEQAAAGNAGLAVLASVDEVVRYLRQRDIVVVSEGNGKYLVNGRFSEGLDALVMRANRLRERQQKPLFQLIPSV